MPGRVYDRRNMIRWGAGLTAGMAFVPRACAQADDTVDIFGLRLPREIAGIKLFAKPFNYARMISSILELERNADQRGLPKSALAFNTGPSLDAPSTATSFYQSTVPRLITLIDRSETSDPGLSDQAGELLAEVNDTQHVVAEAMQEPIRVSGSRDFGSLKAEYAALFASTEVRSDRSENLDWYLKAIEKFRPRYEALAKDVGVPWHFVGLIHGLESSFNFRAHLHNGDFPLSARTRQVPAGRPLVWTAPFTWEASAKDALKLMGFTGQSDWSLERTLYRLEAYNGFGYRKHGVATPYLWSFSNHYERGKFVRDGRWSEEAKSQQCGAATLMKVLTNAKVIEVAV